MRKLGPDEFQSSLSQYERFEEDIAGEISYSTRSDMMKAGCWQLIVNSCFTCSAMWKVGAGGQLTILDAGYTHKRSTCNEGGVTINH